MPVDLLTVTWSLYRNEVELVTEILQILDEIRIAMTLILPEW